MAKQKLKKFKNYCDQLLPHETEYIAQKFTSKDQERIQIVQILRHNSIHPEEPQEYNDDIDKRKYSKTLAWINLELDRIDVDRQISWISTANRDILLDRVPQSLDQEIIKALKHIQISDYNFLQFYEMLIRYRHYLLIRMRYQAHQKVDDYINRNEYDYKRSSLIYEQMHQATSDIIGTGDIRKNEAIQWSKWLLENVRDDRLDGLTKYMSAVRYIFICLRYKSVMDLENILEQLNEFFKGGKNYSKRLLVNFYNNMSIMYDQKQNYDKAKYYGYLSIKYDHPDTIIYLNNLVNILIKMNLFAEALDVMEGSAFTLRASTNFHTTIGFISNQIRCLSKLERQKEAITKGRVFLQAYVHQIMKYRWHRFFSAYHGALILDERYKEIIKNTQLYNLSEREQANYKPQNANQILTIYYKMALFAMKELGLSEFSKFINTIQEEELGNYDHQLTTYLMGLAD